MTETLNAIAENTAVPAAAFSEGKAGKSMSRRWIEKDTPAPEEEAKTKEEIIEHIRNKLREV